MAGAYTELESAMFNRIEAEWASKKRGKKKSEKL